MQNILLRFGYKHDMNAVLPVSGNYVGRYKPFHRAALVGTPWEAAGLEYDLYCLHGIWNFSQVDKLLGYEARYFSILRDPVELFISLWDYASLDKLYHCSLEEYAFANKTHGRFKDRIHMSNLGRNQMLFDLGLPRHQLNEVEAVEKKIEEAEQTFDLIMLSERFDESLVLLKHLLCWDYSDLTSLKLNHRKQESKSVISAEAREALKEWLWGDYMLYDHFAAKFERELTELGSDAFLEKELGKLAAENAKVVKRCVAQEGVDNKELKGEYHLWGQDMLGYKMKEGAECKLYGIAENPFLDLYRKSQGARAREVLKSQGREAPQVFDMKKLNPLSFRLSDGTVDIEALKKIYASPK